MKKQIIKLLFIFIICFGMAIIALPVLAADESGITFTPQTTLGNSEFQAGAKVTIDNSTLGKYIVAIYNYGLGLVAVLSVVMIMYGGWKWIFAGGNASSIQAAKGTITSAIIGLVLALSSYLLLKTINPKLVILDPLPIAPPKITVSGCPGVVTTCDSINNLTIPNDSGQNSVSEKQGYADKYKDNLKGFKMDVCTLKELYNEKCGLPEGLCYWDANADNAQGKCSSILDKSCDYSGQQVGGECDFTPSKGLNLYCETVGNNRCSLGGQGSQCDDVSECQDGFACVSDICVKAQKDGELYSPCTENSDCNQGFICSDDSDVSGGDICLPVTKCNIINDCASGNYKTLQVNGAINSSCKVNGFCDCDENLIGEDSCMPGFECIDTKNGNGYDDNDLCITK